jgi:hypothetical protein
MNKILTAALAAIFLATPIAAFAQDVPTYGAAVDQQQQPPPPPDQAPPPSGAPGGDVPSYAEAPPQDEQIRGRIVSFDGAYSLQVRDERGFVDNIQLHQGTIINPTGLTLAPGMIVSILGYNSGSYFAANEIDTPYSFDAGVPYYDGHPGDFYGPSISLGFFFGNPGWWHGDYFHGGFAYRGGARYYNNVNIHNVYRSGGTPYSGGGHREPRVGAGSGYTSPGGAGYREPRAVPHTTIENPGTFHGRDFVAPRERGGYYHAESASHAAPSHASSHSSGGDHRTH